MARQSAKTLAATAAAATFVTAAPAQANTYTAAPSGQTLVSEMDVGSGPSRTMSSTGPARQSLERNTLAKISDQPMDEDWMSMMAFMEEMVEIRIGETTDPQAERVFEININGKLELFSRGETKTVKRYFVDRLMRMKQTRYTQKEVLDEQGIKQMVNIPHTSIKYDFAITRDDSPHSKPWQRAVLAEQG
jgi:hypothetical protein